MYVPNSPGANCANPPGAGMIGAVEGEGRSCPTRRAEPGHEFDAALIESQLHERQGRAAQGARLGIVLEHDDIGLRSLCAEHAGSHLQGGVGHAERCRHARERAPELAMHASEDTRCPTSPVWQSVPEGARTSADHHLHHRCSGGEWLQGDRTPCGAISTARDPARSASGSTRPQRRRSTPSARSLCERDRPRTAPPRRHARSGRTSVPRPFRCGRPRCRNAPRRRRNRTPTALARPLNVRLRARKLVVDLKRTRPEPCSDRTCQRDYRYDDPGGDQPGPTASSSVRARRGRLTGRGLLVGGAGENRRHGILKRCRAGDVPAYPADLCNLSQWRRPAATRVLVASCRDARLMVFIGRIRVLPMRVCRDCCCWRVTFRRQSPLGQVVCRKPLGPEV